MTSEPRVKRHSALLPPSGNAIKLRKSLAAQRLASPFGGSAEGNMCKRTGFLGA